ncbi:AgmX/PglI C-terminal domain-containing protein [Microvenator marinus]|uniref:AgmX/PglI C-terminal domain-containing protein n=1 Tax=Microvenator marinus TaxID=2600177 RepID=A0A5B8XL65_9DELT|nr:AgmX/PglI C-terminal domain-containing protein [Microvenator marinus]QED26562.1 AgmX/PglI C-terminal domain-containing protein [Microvenator marinus]
MSSSNHNLRVALVWNGTVFQERTFTQTSDPVVTVGSDDTNMFVVETSEVPATFEMFERTDTGYKLRVTEKVDGTFNLSDEDFDLEELVESKKTTKVGSDVHEVSLTHGDWGIVELGTVNIFFQLVEKGEAVPLRGFGERFDKPLLLTIFLGAVVHIAFLLAAFLMFEADPELEDMQNLDRFVKYMVDDVDDPLEEEEVDEPEEDTTGKKAGGEEGKFGDPDEEIPESKIPKVDGEMVDEIDVKNIGVNKALSADALGAGPLKNIFADSDGFDSKMNVAMSGEGGDLVVGRGAGGMGMRGVGKGGGGEGFGRIGGLGKVDTGGGKGTGAKIGRKAAKKVKSRIQTGAPSIGDFCDKNNIRRVVNQRQSAIKYCFEKELQTNPTLSGKVTAQWKVNLDGAVMEPSIAESTLNHKGVEGCITRVIGRLRFEKPNGGICIIQYPFVFSGLDE